MSDQLIINKILLGASQLELSLTDEQAAQLLVFITLIQKWNRTHNLTAITSLEDMVVKHLLDSLSIAPHIDSKSMRDVGSGAGLPGSPLAIYYPEKQFHLVDSSYKRIAFIKEVKRKLVLTNITAHHSKIEDLTLDPQMLILCRAFTSLAGFLSQTAHLLAPKGQWLAMKGAVPEDEIAEVSANYMVSPAVPLTVPGLAASRHLIRITAQYGS